MFTLVFLGGVLAGCIITNIIVYSKSAYGIMDIDTTQKDADKYSLRFEKFYEFEKKKRLVFFVHVNKNSRE